MKTMKRIHNYTWKYQSASGDWYFFQLSTNWKALSFAKAKLKPFCFVATLPCVCFGYLGVKEVSNG